LTGILLVPASAQPAGTAATATITLALSPATVDYGHQNVTASGTVSTSAGPVASAAVTVSYTDIDQQAAQISLTTGANGSYSGTIPDPEGGGVSYVITADLGSTHDRSVVTVMHADRAGDSSRVVLDYIRRWQGTKSAPVPLTELGQAIAGLAAEYRGAQVIGDPWQFKAIGEILSARGIRIDAGGCRGRQGAASAARV